MTFRENCRLFRAACQAMNVGCPEIAQDLAKRCDPWFLRLVDVAIVTLVAFVLVSALAAAIWFWTRPT